MTAVGSRGDNVRSSIPKARILWCGSGARHIDQSRLPVDPCHRLQLRGNLVLYRLRSATGRVRRNTSFPSHCWMKFRASGSGRTIGSSKKRAGSGWITSWPSEAKQRR